MIKVYFKTNSLIAKIAASVLRSDNCAIVIRRTIHLHQISKEMILSDKGLLCHEITHVLQWKKYSVVRFVILYLWYSLKFGYYQNPFEIEARAHETDESVLQNVILL